MISYASIEEGATEEYEMLYEFMCFSGNFGPDMEITLPKFQSLYDLIYVGFILPSAWITDIHAIQNI